MQAGVVAVVQAPLRVNLLHRGREDDVGAVQRALLRLNAAADAVLRLSLAARELAALQDVLQLVAPQRVAGDGDDRAERAAHHARNLNDCRQHGCG